MEKAFLPGTTVHTKVSTSMELSKEKENIHMKQEIAIMVIGKMGSNTDMEFFQKTPGKSFKRVSGKTVNL